MASTAFLAKASVADRALSWAGSDIENELKNGIQNADLTHAAMIFLGVAALFGKKFPGILAGVAAIGAGLWTGLTFQDWQEQGAPFDIHLPEGFWLPIVAGLTVAAAAAALVRSVWSAALALLTASVLALVAVAIIRFANVQPEQLADEGNKMLSSYPLVATGVLVIALVLSALLAVRLYNAMIVFTSAHLASLFLLSGVSYFVQRYGAHEAPFSLLDTFVQLLGKFNNGQCKEESNECDCGAHCRTEIAIWIAMAWIIIVLQICFRCCDRKADKRDFK